MRRSDEVDGDAELVANAALGLETAGVGTDGDEFFPQAYEADFDGGFVVLVFGLAHERADLKVVQAAVGGSHEPGQHGGFGCIELDSVNGALQPEAGPVQAVAAGGRCEARQAPPDGGDGGQQDGRTDRFDEIDIGAALVAGTHVLGSAPGGEHDEPGLRVGLAQALGEVEAIFAGEVEVDEIEMNQIAADYGVHVFGTFQFVDVMALGAEQLGGGDTEAFVVFDQGDA